MLIINDKDKTELIVSTSSASNQDASDTQIRYGSNDSQSPGQLIEVEVDNNQVIADMHFSFQHILQELS